MGVLKRVEYFQSAVLDGNGQMMWGVAQAATSILRGEDPPQSGEDELEINNFDPYTLIQWDGEEHDLLSAEADYPASATWGASRKEESGTF
jgi:hypothetical protein